MLRNILFSFFCFSILGLNGCAVFEGGKVPHAVLTPPKQTVKLPSLTYSSMAKSGLTNATPQPEAVQSIIAGEMLSVFEESKYFTRIAKNDDSADISIDVTITNSGNPAAFIPAIITGLSFYVIPSWATDNFEVVANVESKAGLKKSYTLKDSTTLVQWLPMIFAFPANNFETIPNVRKNLYRTILKNMENDGFFNQETTAVALKK